MSASIKGTAHFFGSNTTLTNATVQSISSTAGFDLSEATQNEVGQTIETRKDDRVKRVTIVARIRSGYDFPDEGSVIALANMFDNAFNGNYELEEKSGETQNNQFFEQTLSLVQHDEISYT